LICCDITNGGNGVLTPDRIEIIGNRFDHPYLLKGEGQ